MSDPESIPIEQIRDEDLQTVVMLADQILDLFRGVKRRAKDIPRIIEIKEHALRELERRGKLNNS